MYYVADMTHIYKVAQSSCIFVVLMTVTTSRATLSAMAQLQTRPIWSKTYIKIQLLAWHYRPSLYPPLSVEHLTGLLGDSVVQWLACRTWDSNGRCSTPVSTTPGSSSGQAQAPYSYLPSEVWCWQVSSRDKHCIAVLGRLYTRRSDCPG